MVRRTLSTTLIACLILGWSPKAGSDEPRVQDAELVGQRYVANELIVKFRPGVAGRLIQTLLNREGASLARTGRSGAFHRLRLKRAARLRNVLERLRGDSIVEYAEPNYLAQAHFVPNDPLYSLQWHLDNAAAGGLDMEAAWEIEQGNPGVVVAVVDTGVAYENYSSSGVNYELAPDLAGTYFAPGFDFVNNDTHPNDDQGHGTHVSGSIAQRTDNGLGVAGIAPHCTIMPVKVLNASGSGSYADIADGIRYAAQNGAKIINLSLGGSSPSSVLEEALAYAYNQGVTMICSAGNDGYSNQIGYPAAYDQYCIAVGATRYDEQLSYYTNQGSSVDVSAPGGDITVDQNSDGYGDGVLQQTFSDNPTNWSYWFYQGTSMSAANVSGVAALIISHGLASTPNEVRSVLESTAKDRGPAGWDPGYGHGIVNAAAALEATPTPPPQPPPPTSPGFADSFDDNPWDALWTQDSQNDWKRSNQNSTTGIYSAQLDGLANDSKLTSVAIGLEGQDFATLRFSWLIESGFDAGEYLACDYSPDGGGTWIEVARLRGNLDPENVWHHEEHALHDLSSLRIRFRGSASSSSEDAYVDDVEVLLSGSPAPPPPPQTNQPPTSVPGGPYNGETGSAIQFDGSGSSDPDDDPLDFSWDFGDGSSGVGVSPSHTYAAPGIYMVILTVADSGGLSSEAQTTATIADPPPPGGEPGFNDGFEDSPWDSRWEQDSQNDWKHSSQRTFEGSFSAEVDGFANDALLVSKPIDLGGQDFATLRFAWLIEYGLDAGEYLACDYSPDGGATWIEIARLRGNVDEETVWHEEAIPLSGLSSLRVRFRADISSSTEDAFVDHVRVQLSENPPPSPENQAPDADAGGPYTGESGFSIAFDGSASVDPDGDPLSYEWDFGDGSGGTGSTPTHVYTAAATYSVTLTVTDDGGLSAQSQTTATVSEPAPPPPPPGGSASFEDGFEGSPWDFHWTQDGQNDWKRSSARSSEGDSSAEVDGTASDSALISASIDLNGYSRATLSFSWFIERGVDLDEYLACDISSDGGASWIEIARLRGNVDPEHVWVPEEFQLTNLTSLRLRFRGKLSNSAEDAYVDDVRVVPY